MCGAGPGPQTPEALPGVGLSWVPSIPARALRRLPRLGSAALTGSGAGWGPTASSRVSGERAAGHPQCSVRQHPLTPSLPASCTSCLCDVSPVTSKPSHLNGSSDSCPTVTVAGTGGRLGAGTGRLAHWAAGEGRGAARSLPGAAAVAEGERGLGGAGPGEAARSVCCVAWPQGMPTVTLLRSRAPAQIRGEGHRPFSWGDSPADSQGAAQGRIGRTGWAPSLPSPPGRLPPQDKPVANGVVIY